jgi:hypothetical protein
MSEKKSSLLWSKKLFFNYSKIRNIIGFDISVVYKIFGRVTSIDGLCLSRKGKNGGLFCSSLELRKKIHNDFIFIKLFIYFGSAYKFKVIGFSFKKKFINFSKISYKFLNK